MPGTSFKGKVVLVTGAGSSVGAEVGRVFSKLGASVVLTDGKRDLQIKIDKESGPSCLALSGDLTKPLDVINIISQTISKYKKLDILVNCVGFTENTLVGKEFSLLQQFDRTMSVTVRSVYHVVLLAAPHLIKSRGNVVNIVHLTDAESLANSVAKSSLDQLTKCLALDLAPNGVRVNSVTTDLPEEMTTEMYLPQKTVPSSENPNNSTNAGKDCTGTSAVTSELYKDLCPEDVADCVMFLVSDAASFITGTNTPVIAGKNSTSPVTGSQNKDSHGNAKEDNSDHKAESPDDNQGKKDENVREGSAHNDIKKELSKHPGNDKLNSQGLLKDVTSKLNSHEDSQARPDVVKTGHHSVEHKLSTKPESVKKDTGKSVK